MKQSLNIKLSQGLKLTPQLQQSIRLLQLSSVELNNEIQDMLDSNPLLDEDAVNVEKSKSDSEAKAEKESKNQEQENEWQESSYDTRQTQSSASSQEPMDVYATTAKIDSLTEQLIWQIQMTKLSDKDKLIAESIIHSIDEQGYLKFSNEELMNLFPEGLEVDQEEIQAVLTLVKTFDPAGIAARDLPERLRIILNSIERSNPESLIQEEHITAKDIITNYFDLLSNRDIKSLKASLNLPQEKLIDAIQYIQKINPHIAQNNDKDDNLYIIPDIIIKKANNEWKVLLNPNIHRSIKLNDTYISIPKEKLTGDDNQYISTSLQEAKWFIKSLNNRYDTLKRVASSIVSHQLEFFKQGESALKPMVLQKIADDLELHESTISRATSNKYMQTPLGVFELKYFFSTSLSSNSGEDVSSTSIRSIIKKLIDEEEKQKPISDSKIAKAIEKQGFNIARRTVAKYREGMNIPSSSKRKSLI